MIKLLSKTLERDYEKEISSTYCYRFIASRLYCWIVLRSTNRQNTIFRKEWFWFVHGIVWCLSMPLLFIVHWWWFVVHHIKKKRIKDLA